MHRFEFQLHITPEQYLEYYRGRIRNVMVQCSTGKTVQFPAALLQRFVAHDGIHGSFALTCDEDYKNAQLHRL